MRFAKLDCKLLLTDTLPELAVLASVVTPGVPLICWIKLSKLASSCALDGAVVDRLSRKACVVAGLDTPVLAMAGGGGGGMLSKKLPCPLAPAVVWPCCVSAASKLVMNVLNAVSALEASAVAPVVVDEVLSDACAAARAW